MKTKSRWPINQVAIDERLAVGGEPVPVFFVADASGEPYQLIGTAENLAAAADTLRVYMVRTIETLLAGGGEDLNLATLRLCRKDMTNEEIEAIPAELGGSRRLKRGLG